MKYTKTKKHKSTQIEGLAELNMLYIDLDTLIKTIVEDEKPIGDYRQLGVRIIDPRENHFDMLRNLSHLMYNTVVTKNPPNDGLAMRVFVDKSSYDETRRIVIDGIIRALAELGSASAISKAAQIDYMSKAFLWLEKEYGRLPSDIKEARGMFASYKEYLNKLVKASEANQTYAAYFHQGMLRLLSGILQEETSSISADIGLIITVNKRSNAYHNTKVFSQEELGYAFAFYYHLFDQIADFLLDKKSYPYVIKLPRGNATLLPNPPIGGSGAMIAPAYEPPSKGNVAVNYELGRILNDEDIETIISNLSSLTQEKKNGLRNNIKSTRKKLLANLELTNSQHNHPIRLGLGKKAMQAWFMCMLYLAPFNDSTLAQLKWGESDEFEVERGENKEFRSIKYRAQNKPVRFKIPNAFLNSFRKFLRLRKFVLDGHECEYLFFGGFGREAKLSKRQQRGTYGTGIAASFIGSLDSQLPKITSRSSRKDAGRDALSSHGLHVALSILQNNEAIFLRHYNGQTVEEMAEQVNSFLENVHGIINSKPLEKIHESATGECKYTNNPIPKPINNYIPVDPDCNDPKSCIFCEHFRTYPDREQIRKLISIQYIIKNIAYPRAEDDSHYEKAMGPWLKRIDALLGEMSMIEPDSKDTIEEVREEVFNDGMLSQYWLEWTEMLENLGRFA